MVDDTARRLSVFKKTGDLIPAKAMINLYLDSRRTTSNISSERTDIGTLVQGQNATRKEST
jgi:hypothetical protein